MRPAAIIGRTPARALRVLPSGIFVGEGGQLKQVYTFTPQAEISADAPLSETFRVTMREHMRIAIPKAVRASFR